MSTFRERRTTITFLYNMLLFPGERDVSDAREEFLEVVNEQIDTVELLHEMMLDSVMDNMAQTWEYREICNSQDCPSTYQMELYLENRNVNFYLIVDVYHLWQYLKFLCDLRDGLQDFMLAVASF